MKNAAILVLAAGSSSRLGTPKQLLPYKGKALLLHVVEAAVQVAPAAVVVVTGADGERIAEVLAGSLVRIVHNPQWQLGMASGIVAGITALMPKTNAIENIIIAVCDQPYVSAALFRQMLDKQKETKKGIVACHYANTIGTPVLFSSKYHVALMALQGEEGAKKILKKFGEDVASVSFEAGVADVDTMQNYIDILKRNEYTSKD